VSEALNRIDTEGFEVAILDVNLQDELIYPVAELLMSRDIPFIFITGYAPETIDRRFKDVVTLQKPVESEKLQLHFPPGPPQAAMRGVA
jgi:two-component SAPR family response regulator